MPSRFDNTYARELPGMSIPCRPEPSPRPKLLLANHALAAALGPDIASWFQPEGLDILAGNRLPDGAEPVAQAYAGHQFGGFSPQLGDGRALLIGEVLDIHGQRRDLAFKGSGRTPFSRGGDGRAALGPVLREYLISEAMHALQAPTTRVLSAVSTGGVVYRDRPLPGGLLIRVADSHLRVGTFEFFSARGETDRVRQLADYAIARHAPAALDDDNPYLAFLRHVIERQAALVAQWMSLGFIHGVMNTDNTSIAGETLDFGPCAFLEAYDPTCVFSSIDRRGRYAFGNQPAMAQWNLARLAETLLFLFDDDPARAVAKATEVLETFSASYADAWLQRHRAKMGLSSCGSVEADHTLVQSYLSLLEQHQVDFTSGFRFLHDVVDDRTERWAALFGDPDHRPFDEIQDFVSRYRARLAQESPSKDEIRIAMNRVNPIYIPRNHLVEEALRAAVDEENLAPIEKLLAVLAAPFDERAEHAAYASSAPRAFTENYRTFCGT